MIVPMKKYIFLVHHSDYINFLDELRGLGVLHVQHQKGEPSEELVRRIQLQKDIRDTLAALRHRIVTETEGTKLSEDGGIAIVRTFQKLTDEQEKLQQELNALKKEISFLKPWGNFSTHSLSLLEQAGQRIRFFICPARKYRPEWEQQFPVAIINTISPNIYFVAITSPDETIPIDAEEIPRPESGLSGLQAKSEALQQQIDAIDDKLDNFTLMAQPALEAALADVESSIQLVSVVDNTHKEAEDTVMVLEVFVPVGR